MGQLYITCRPDKAAQAPRSAGVSGKLDVVPETPVFASAQTGLFRPTWLKTAWSAARDGDMQLAEESLKDALVRYEEMQKIYASSH